MLLPLSFPSVHFGCQAVSPAVQAGSQLGHFLGPGISQVPLFTKILFQIKQLNRIVLKILQQLVVPHPNGPPRTLHPVIAVMGEVPVDGAPVDRRTLQYLYDSSGQGSGPYVFMDGESFDQIEIDGNAIPQEQSQWMKEGIEVVIMTPSPFILFSVDGITSSTPSTSKESESYWL